MNYIVVCSGHIALFEQYGLACEFVEDFGGRVFNLWGLLPHNMRELKV